MIGTRMTMARICAFGVYVIDRSGLPKCKRVQRPDSVLLESRLRGVNLDS